VQKGLSSPSTGDPCTHDVDVGFRVHQVEHVTINVPLAEIVGNGFSEIQSVERKLHAAALVVRFV
jgi:hypothetical protein